MVIIVVSGGTLIEIVEDCQSKAISFCNLFNLFKSRKGKKRRGKKKQFSIVYEISLLKF